MNAVRVIVLEEEIKFATCHVIPTVSLTLDSEERRSRKRTYLSDPTNVFLAVLGRETEVLVEPEADVVPVEAEGTFTRFEEGELEGTRESRFSRSCE